MINVGIAGIGFMGWIHYLAYQRVNGVRLAALSSRDEKKRAGDWRGIKGNFGPEGEQVDLTGVAAYASLEQLLEDASVELVDICLPPDMHAEVATRALQAGKHVFVEKPMALTTAECDQIVAAAEQAGKQALVGHVLPFFPEYTHARQLIEQGTYGRLLGGSHGQFKIVILKMRFGER